MLSMYMRARLSWRPLLSVLVPPHFLHGRIDFAPRSHRLRYNGIAGAIACRTFLLSRISGGLSHLSLLPPWHRHAAARPLRGLPNLAGGKSHVQYAAARAVPRGLANRILLGASFPALERPQSPTDYGADDKRSCLWRDSPRRNSLGCANGHSSGCARTNLLPKKAPALSAWPAGYTWPACGHIQGPTPRQRLAFGISS